MEAGRVGSAAMSPGDPFGYVMMTDGDNGPAVLKRPMMEHLNPFLTSA
jgi:hypothetical protein